MPCAANSTIMGTVLRVVLLGVVILLPGGLLLLPFLALHQLRKNQKADPQVVPNGPVAVRS